MKKLVCLSLIIFSVQVFGQSFPNHPVRLVVPWPPAGNLVQEASCSREFATSTSNSRGAGAADLVAWIGRWTQ